MVTELAERGVDAGVIMVVPNGVDESLLTEQLSPREARAVLNIGMDDEFVVGAVSALVDYEGFDTLLRAAALLISDSVVPAAIRKRLRVVIAGDGTAAPGLRALAAELGITDRVIMPGRVPRHTARYWVQALDVVVVPRHDVEVARAVTPQKPVEAMALGRPVIISDLPALRETATATDDTLCAVTHTAGSGHELAEAIREIGTGAARAERLVEQGRKVAAGRTWPALVRRYGMLYADAIGRSREELTRG